MDSFLPVGMAALLEGEGELVLPAVPGFLWSHLEKGNAQQKAHHMHGLMQTHFTAFNMQQPKYKL